MYIWRRIRKMDRKWTGLACKHRIYACTIYGKDWCVPSRRESRAVASMRPLSSRCCRAEGSDLIPGHSLIVSQRRDEYSCASGPLGKDARLLQPRRTRSSSAERSMMHNDSSDRNSGQAIIITLLSASSWPDMNRSLEQI